MKKQKTEGLKSIYLELQNFKNISKKVIDIGGRSMIILGPNGAGKSSIIQAMQSPLDSKLIPTEPIKIGEERARIIHKIGGLIKDAEGNLIDEEYTLDIVFTPGNKAGKLEVFNKNGEKLKSPASLVKSIIGNVSLDLNKWLNEPKAKKLEMIKNLSGSRKEVDMINQKIEETKALLKRKKDRAEDLEGALKNHEFSKEEIDKYSVQIPIESLQESLSLVAKSQEQWDGVKNRVAGFKADNQRHAEQKFLAYKEIDRLNALIEEQKKYIQEQSALEHTSAENIKKGEEWLEKYPRPSSEEIAAQMNAAISHNKNFDRISMLSNQQREMLNAKQEVDKLKVEIDALVDSRTELFKKSQLNIPGFSFDNDNLYIDGLPIEEGQQNTERLWNIGVDIAIALDPNYKVIFIKDGSMFDRAHFNAIIKKIEDKGYMAIIEVVEFDGHELHVNFFENEIN